MRCPSPLSRPLPAGLWRWQSAFRIWSERMRSCPPPRFVPARGIEPQNMRCPLPLSPPLPAGLWRWQSAFRARRGECVRARRRGSFRGAELSRKICAVLRLYRALSRQGHRDGRALFGFGRGECVRARRRDSFRGAELSRKTCAVLRLYRALSRRGCGDGRALFGFGRSECVRARRRGSARGRERFEPQNMRCPSPLSRPLPARPSRWQSAFRARRGAEESAQSLPIYEYPAGENIACGARENPSALFYSCGMAGFVDGGPSIPRRIAQYRAGLRSRSRAVRALFCHVRTECASARRTGA